MKRTSSSLPHLARGLFTALVLLSLSSSFAASSDSIPVAAATAAATAAVEATICAVGAKQAADETTTSSCGAFFEPGAPLSSEEVSAIVAGALPAQARSEADSSPFNATVPCPTTLLIGSGIDAARVEAQLGVCLNSMRTEPDRYSSIYPCSYSSWRNSALSPKRQPLVLTGSGASILGTAARSHSTEMATKNFFSHNSADRTSAATRITKKFGYPSAFVGENIAAGQQTVLAVCAAWMCSSGHRTNILRCGFDTLGSGVAINAGSSRYGIYYTHDFGCSKSAGGCDSCGATVPQPPSPAPTPMTSPVATPPATTKPPSPPPPPPPPTTPAPTSPPTPVPTSPPTPPPPAGSAVTKFSGSTSSSSSGGSDTWWRPIASGSALAGPIGRDVRFQAVQFSPSATGDYGLVVTAGPSATTAYAGEPWDNYCFVYATSAFDKTKQLADLLRGNDDFGNDGEGGAHAGKCGFSGLPLVAGKTYTLVVTSYSRAGEGSWEAQVVYGPGGFVIVGHPNKSAAIAAVAAVAAPAVAAPVAAAPVAATAPASSSTLTLAAGGAAADVSSQQRDWVAAESASAAAAEYANEEEEVSAMFAEEEVARQMGEKAFEEGDH